MVFTHITGNETLSKKVKLCLFDVRRFTGSLFFILLSLLYVKITLIQADPKKKLTRSLVSEALTRTNGFFFNQEHGNLDNFSFLPRSYLERQSTEILPNLTISSLFLTSPAPEVA